MKRVLATGSALAMAVTLSACGTTTQERVASGALGGAAAGAVLGGDLKGAVIGGAAGAAGGYVVDRCKNRRDC